jgi:hypothetical protein
MASGVFGLKKVYKRQYDNVKEGNFANWPESAAYGYFGGGFSTLPSLIYATVERLDYSNEVVTSPGKNLPAFTHTFIGVFTNLYCYFGGGLYSSGIIY